MKNILLAIFLGLSSLIPIHAQEGDEYEEMKKMYKAMGMTDEQIEEYINQLKGTMNKTFDNLPELMKNAPKEVTIESTSKDDLVDAESKLDEIEAKYGRYSKEYMNGLVNLRFASFQQIVYSGSDSSKYKNYNSKIESLKFEVLRKFGYESTTYQEVASQTINTSQKTSSAMKEYGKNPTNDILKIESIGEKPIIAGIAHANLSTYPQSNYYYDYLYNYLAYSQIHVKNAAVSEINQRLNIESEDKVTFALKLFKEAYLNSNTSHQKRSLAFYKMIRDFCNFIDTEIADYENKLITPEEAYNILLKNEKYKSLSKDELQIQANYFSLSNNSGISPVDVDANKQLRDEVRLIYSDKTNLSKDISRFNNAYTLYFDIKNAREIGFTEYIKKFKYNPQLLINYVDYVSKNESNLDSFDKEGLEKIKEYYVNSGLNQLETTDRFDLSKWAEYRNLFLNIWLDFSNDRFGGDLQSFITLDDILSSKGGDFKSKKFIIEGIRESKSNGLEEYYSYIKNEKSKLSALSLLDNSDLSANGWSTNRLQKELNAISKKEDELYHILGDYLNVGEYFNQWFVSSSAIKKSLKKNEAFLDIHRVEDLEDKNKITYIVIRITKNNLDIRSLENGYELENEAFESYTSSLVKGLENVENRGFKNKIKNSIEQPDSSYSKYWRPMVKGIGYYGNNDIDTYYISTDGVYNKVSFNSLKNHEENKYLIDEGKVVTINELTDINSITSNESSKKDDFHLFGRPKYYLDSYQSNQQLVAANISNTASRNFSENNVITDLPGTEQEIMDISDILMNNQVKTMAYLGQNANEKALKALKNPGVLHIATHGFFSEELSSSSFGSGYFSYQKSKLINNPFLRCGLLMTGSGNSLKGQKVGEEDGILTGEEIVHLPLINTDLVVLSACETGLGKQFNGEGVMGLQRAFLLAGAKSVIMTLWEVDDDATQKLMTYFYDFWVAQQKSKREAFRAAQLKLKEEYNAPYFWGAFVMLGE